MLLVNIRDRVTISEQNNNTYIILKNIEAYV